MKKSVFNFLFLVLISFGCWLNSPGIQSVFHAEIHKLQGIPCETGSSSADHQDCLVQSLLSSLLLNVDYDSEFNFIPALFTESAKITAFDHSFSSFLISGFHYARGPPVFA